MFIACLLLIPLLSAIVLAFLGTRPVAAKVNIIASALSFMSACGLAIQIQQQKIASWS